MLFPYHNQHSHFDSRLFGAESLLPIDSTGNPQPGNLGASFRGYLFLGGFEGKPKGQLLNSAGTVIFCVPPLFSFPPIGVSPGEVRVSHLHRSSIPNHFSYFGGRL